MSLYGRVGAGMHARPHRKNSNKLPHCRLVNLSHAKTVIFSKSFANIEGMMEKLRENN